MKKPKNLRSEAAIKRVISYKGNEPLVAELVDNNIFIYIPAKVGSRGEVIAIIDLIALVKKRKPLTGVKKQLDAIVRGSKKKRVKK